MSALSETTAYRETTTVYPTIDNAPGLTWRLLPKSGWEAKWEVSIDVAREGYEPRKVRLWAGHHLTEGDRETIASKCRTLQSWADHWISNRPRRAPIKWDGTLHSLIDNYRNDPFSEYHKKRYVTRQNYDTACDRLIEDRGSTVIADMRGRTLKEWQADWEHSGITMAHGLMRMLGIVLSFGVTMLDCDHCAKVALVKSKSRFKNAKPRTQVMTPEEVTAVVAEANRRGKHSIALAQALAFNCGFRQKDVIGERVPLHDGAVGYLILGNEKWLRGLLWEEIDDLFVLHHVTSKKEKLVEPPLLYGPMIVAELRRTYPGCITEEVDEVETLNQGKTVMRLVPHRELLPAKGPIIIAEETGAPYKTATFRRHWRQIADGAGIPKAIKQMDTRASFATAATNAGVSLDDLAKAMTHSHTHQTSNYSRDQSGKHANTMKKIAESFAAKQLEMEGAA